MNNAIVGSGAAYVFVRSGVSWTQQTKLVGGNPSLGQSNNQRFGNAVSLAGDTALIGAYFNDDRGSNSGSAYVFVRSGATWSQQAKLLASDGAASNVWVD